MSYLALYREFRPKTFDELVGQEHVVKTLTNQIKNDRIGHAYLFCGARGTGKTTVAKIFARAINCVSTINGSPCGKCEVCKSLENSNNLDIIEMDAASNNGVDDIREIRDKVQYPPVAGKYKVYIVDEVHMLTAGAFNALLKTLEEPPKHAVFILATTEVHKVPATILSRCLRFDFKLLPTNEIAKYISSVYDRIGKKYQKESVNLIAKAGEGSVRDAMSIADICVSYSDETLTYDDVLDVLGSSDRTKIEMLIKNIFLGQTGEVLSIIDDLCMRGKSVGVLNKDVCNVLRDLLVVKTCSNAGELLALPNDKLEEFKKLANDFDNNAILRAIELFSNVESDLKYSTHPKIIFETACVKASMPRADYNIDALLSRVTKLENALTNGCFANVEKSDKPLNSSVKQVKQVEQTQNSESQVTQVLQNENKQKQVVNEDANVQTSFINTNVESESSVDSKKVEEVAVDDKKDSVIQEKAVSSQPKQVEKVSEKQDSKASGVVVWGKMLKKMREEKLIMLWVACQELKAKISGNKLIIVANSENEYTFISKQENVNKLSEIANSFGDYQVFVTNEEQEVAPDNSETIKQMFEGEDFEIK